MEVPLRASMDDQRFLDPESISYHCSCSRERTVAVLPIIDRQALEGILA